VTRTWTILGLLAVIAAASAASCSVSRRSTGYACDGIHKCDANRECSQGFCVERTGTDPGPGSDGGVSKPGCPPGCTSCDLTDQTCDIECGIGLSCDKVVCPAGFDCTIFCTAPGTCGDIDCTGGGFCDITCIGDAACPRMQCAGGACDITCIGANACGVLDCANACACDESCNLPGACAPALCPIAARGPCTEDGSPNGACDSTASGACDRCP